MPATRGDGRLTVVVMTWNRRPELLRTLGRMTALPERPQIIVADNGSTDGSADAVAARFPQVRLLRGRRNVGALARNAAVRRVESPYVAFCDDDTWWEPGALGTAADLLDAHEGLGSVTGRIVVEPEGTEDPIVPELSGSPVPAPGWLPGPALLGILAGASMLRVSAFREVGGFSPKLRIGGEEELLAIDLAACGWWMCYREDVVVHHAASAVRDARQRRRQGIRNTLWTTWSRRPVRSALRRTSAVLDSLPRDRTSALAVAEALAGLPWVLRERRVVPRPVEHGLRLLEGPQRTSVARRYVG
jgi:GT2 family glycosyltransferase